MAKLTQLARAKVLSPLKHNVVVPAAESVVRTLTERKIRNAYRDPRISYPCYKSLDDIIDSATLKSLDTCVSEGIEKHLRAQEDRAFDSGYLTLKSGQTRKAGSRMISLSKAKHSGVRYADLNNPDLWIRGEAADEFPLLMKFIATLPFKRTARMMIMYDVWGGKVTPHRDHSVLEWCHEFIWFRTNLKKPFYMLNPETGERRYVESHSAWFDTVNQFHAADPCEGLSFSIRVDGIFTDEFRQRIPKPKRNAASTAALWACTGDSR